MVRPPAEDWAVLDLDGDPAPGDLDILRRLAVEYDGIADDAESAASVIDRLQNQDLGEGKSMDKLRESLDELPGQVRQLRDSYRVAAQALEAYIPRLETHQDQADRALRLGQDAQERLSAAMADFFRLDSDLLALMQADPPPPDDAQARTAARDAVARTQAAQNSAQNTQDGIEAELTAAKRLASDAEQLRKSDAAVASTELNEAGDNAVKKKSFFDGLWDEILGLVLGIVATVAAVAFLFIPGGLLIGIGIGLTLGAAAFGLTLAKIIVTGDLKGNLTDLILGVVGLGLGVIGGAIAALKAIPSLGNLFRGIGNLGRIKPVAPPASTPPVIKPPTTPLTPGPGGPGIKPPATPVPEAPVVKPPTPGPEVPPVKPPAPAPEAPVVKPPTPAPEVPPVKPPAPAPETPVVKPPAPAPETPPVKPPTPTTPETPPATPAPDTPPVKPPAQPAPDPAPPAAPTPEPPVVKPPATAPEPPAATPPASQPPAPTPAPTPTPTPANPVKPPADSPFFQLPGKPTTGLDRTGVVLDGSGISLGVVGIGLGGKAADEALNPDPEEEKGAQA